MHRFLPCLTAWLLLASAPRAAEPTTAEEAARAQSEANAKLAQPYAAWKATLPPERQAWETVLEQNLGSFYLPLHQRDKIAGRSNAWDFVADDPHLPRILLIGDSVSRGYTQQVRTALGGFANVHRAPANCGPTATGLKKLDVWLGDGTWDLIHFNFGIHDRATPPADYTARLRQIVERLQATGAQLVWATTTPIPDGTHYGPAAAIVEKNALAAEIMTQEGIAINDLHTAMLPKVAELQNPGDVHFNAAGYDFLGAQVAAFIEQQLTTASRP